MCFSVLILVKLLFPIYKLLFTFDTIKIKEIVLFYPLKFNAMYENDKNPKVITKSNNESYNDYQKRLRKLMGRFIDNEQNNQDVNCEYDKTNEEENVRSQKISELYLG